MSTAARTATPVGSNLLQAAGIAALGAIVANLVLYFLASAIVGIPEDFTALNPASVIFSTLFGVIAATLFFAALIRFTAQPVRWFRIITVLATLFSFGGPISAGAGNMEGMPAIEGGLVFFMILMHIVTAGIVVGVLTTRGVES